jgi:hypothetical protein
MKLKAKIIYKILKSKMPKAYIIVFLHIVLRQRDTAKIHNLHYKELMDSTGYCRQTVYDAILYLDSHRFINIGQRSIKNGVYTIEIVGNIFKTNSKEHFLNLNDAEILSEDFKKLNKTELKIVLYTKLGNFKSKKKSDNGSHIGVQKLCKMFQIKSVYNLKKNIEMISQKFEITASRSEKNITFNKDVLSFCVKENRTTKFKYDDYLSYLHSLKVVCIENRIAYKLEDLYEIALLVNQYYKQISQHDAYLCISKWIRSKEKTEPKFLHMILRKEKNII